MKLYIIMIVYNKFNGKKGMIFQTLITILHYYTQRLSTTN